MKIALIFETNASVLPLEERSVRLVGGQTIINGLVYLHRGAKSSIELTNEIEIVLDAAAGLDSRSPRHRSLGVHRRRREGQWTVGGVQPIGNGGIMFSCLCVLG